MIPPTSIDGTDITGATIDGTDVQEITVDGDVVFSAGLNLSPNLKHYWTFDDADVSGNTVFDTVGNIDGTISGGVTTGVAGELGEAFIMDGENDGEVNFGSIPICESATEFTLSIFVKNATPAADWDRSNGNIFGDFRDFNDAIYMGLLDDNTVFTNVERSGTRTSLNTNDSLNLNTFQHYVLVWDAPTAETYLNGNSIGANNGPSQTMSSTDFYIAYRTGRNYHTNVTVDEARIYDKALTSTEVNNLKNTGSIL